MTLALERKVNLEFLSNKNKLVYDPGYKKEKVTLSFAQKQVQIQGSSFSWIPHWQGEHHCRTVGPRCQKIDALFCCPVSHML